MWEVLDGAGSAIQPAAPKCLPGMRAPKSEFNQKLARSAATEKVFFLQKT
jgi:hypothetical protein